jgi:hypothetical protein
MTITPYSCPKAVVGCRWGATFTRTGSSAWTNATVSTAAPLSMTGPSGARIINQHTTGGNTCQCVVYTGDVSSGTLTFTDTVNGDMVTVTLSSKINLHPQTGSTIYTGGGISQPKNLCQAGTSSASSGTGGASVAYQVIATNQSGSGTTGSFNVSMVTAKAIPAAWSGSGTTQLFNSRTGLGSVYVANYNVPNTFGPDYITVACSPVPGATGYIFLRSMDGVTWYWNGTIQSSPSLKDDGSWTTSYTIGNANTTATGNDSTGNGSLSTPYATLHKALSVATAGQGICILGYAYDTVQCVGVAGVNIFGQNNDPTQNGWSTTYDSTGGGPNVSFVLPSSADVYNLEISTLASSPTTTNRLMGIGSSDSGTVTDCNVLNCRVRGTANCISFAKALCGAYFTNVTQTSGHGTFGLVSGATDTVINYTRGSISTPTWWGDNNSGLPINVVEGFLQLRDTTGITYVDSNTYWDNALLTTTLYVAPTSPAVAQVDCINTTIVGAAQSFQITGGANSGIYVRGTSQLDVAQQSTTGTEGTLTYDNATLGTYLPDPAINPSTDPGVSNVLSGTNYEINGVPLTGTLAAGGNVGQQFTETVSATATPAFSGAIIMASTDTRMQCSATIGAEPSYAEVWGQTDSVSAFVLVSSPGTSPLPANAQSQIEFDIYGPMYALKFRTWTTGGSSTNTFAGTI